MNLQELYNIVEQQVILCEQRHQDPATIKVCIPIQTVTAVGGTPCIDVKQANKGFDWDDNKFMLYPEKDLSLTDHDYLAIMRKEAEDMGWTAYEVRNLKRENKKLRQQLAELKNEMALSRNPTTIRD